MSRGNAGVLIRGLEQLFGSGTVSGLGENALVERFVSRRDPAAFEAIVRRHGPMVWTVCRRSLRDPNDAEDAFQSTFLIFAAKAGSIRRGDKLGGWLHGVAVKVSSRARRDLSKRPKEVDDFAETSTTDPIERRDQVAVLHEELARLPCKYRDPIVLCHLEGCTHDEAAARLGWPVGTVRGRLSRGRDQLKERLIRRGMAGAMVGYESVPFPIELGRRAVTAATKYATAKTAVGLLSVQGASWFAWGVRTMTIKSWLVSGIVALGVVGAGGAGGLVYAFQDAPRKEGEAKVVEKATGKAVEKGVEAEQEEVRIKESTPGKVTAEAEPTPDREELEAKIKMVRQRMEITLNSIVQREEVLAKLESDVRSGVTRSPGGRNVGQQVDPEAKKRNLERQAENLERTKANVAYLRESRKKDRDELARLESQLAALKQKPSPTGGDAAKKSEVIDEAIDTDELEFRIALLRNNRIGKMQQIIEKEGQLRAYQSGEQDFTFNEPGSKEKGIQHVKTEIINLRRAYKQDGSTLVGLEGHLAHLKFVSSAENAIGSPGQAESLARSEAELETMRIDLEETKVRWENTRGQIRHAEQILETLRHNPRQDSYETRLKEAEVSLDRSRQSEQDDRKQFLESRLRLGVAQIRFDAHRQITGLKIDAPGASSNVESRLSRIEQALERLEKANAKK